ncbi:MAG TPA: LUD domain-containing protein [Streptosporangiaceae bacterium]
MSARDEVMARIRAASGNGGAGPAGSGPDAASASHPRLVEPPVVAYRERGELYGEALLSLLAERLTDYRALVRIATPAILADEIRSALQRRDARTVVVPPELRLPLPEFAEVTVDDRLTAAELDSFDAVITRAAVAVAETGTIILDGSPDQGRRAVSLVPDYHLCIVAADQVVHLVPEAVARLAASATRPLTWISGPSATSDIELERVEGVHGPRTLEVILVTHE